MMAITRWLSTILHRRGFYLIAPFALLALAVLFVPLQESTPPTERHITLDAGQSEFAPGRFEVNRGDRVIVTLAASDVVHGFYLDGYGIEERVEPGLTKRIEFVASQSGKFRYRCSVSCGPLHPFMIGELIVGANFPFWRAAGVSATALMGMLVYLWKSKGAADEPTQETSE
jgi:heme/copper-type cytochrome/quinol oxidase subunit 2